MPTHRNPYRNAGTFTETPTETLTETLKRKLIFCHFVMRAVGAASCRVSMFYDDLMQCIAHLFWDYQSSPPCTGTLIVNKNMNASKLTAHKLAYHRKCHRCVSNAKKLIKMYKRGGFLESKFTKPCSGEQPRFASFPRRGTWSPGAPRLVSRKQMQSSVYGCVVGRRLMGRLSSKEWPLCKAWVIQTDHPGLAGMLSQSTCPGQHQSCPTLVEHRNQDFASLSATASHPRAFVYVFMLSLTLRRSNKRECIV